MKRYCRRKSSRFSGTSPMPAISTACTAMTAVTGVPKDSMTYYMGSTGGGVWKTTDYGMVWNPVSDGFFSTPSVGDIAVAQNDANIVYVGTGSDGLRSNVITGKGVYRSDNAGRTWRHIGLDVVHCVEDVAAAGHAGLEDVAHGNRVGLARAAGFARGATSLPSAVSISSSVVLCSSITSTAGQSVWLSTSLITTPTGPFPA